MAKIKKIKLPNDSTEYEFEGSVTDISDTTSNIDSITTNYPDVSASDKASALFGKIKKFLSDLKSKKQDKITGAATTITSSNLTANRILQSDANGKVAASGYEFDINTNNTSDTWLLVMKDSKIQHRLISSLADVSRAVKLKDYTNNNDSYLDYGSAAMSDSNVTYIGAWHNDNGKFRLRAIKKADITVGSANGLNKVEDNPTYSTPAAWGSASGDRAKLYWFNTLSKIANQPSHYGFLLHLGLSYGEGHQVWFEQANGSLYHRGFNAGSNLSSLTFKKLLDTSNGIASLSQSGSIYAGRSLGVYASSETMIAGTDKGNRIWACSSGSDKRLKKNIKDSEVKGLELINAIHLVEFDFKDKKFGTHEEIGYIAQELIDIIPEAVVEVPTEEEDKKYGDSLLYVEDKPLIKYLVKAVQELTDIVDKQQIQIDELKNRVVALKEVIEY